MAGLQTVYVVMVTENMLTMTAEPVVALWDRGLADSIAARVRAAAAADSRTVIVQVKSVSLVDDAEQAPGSVRGIMLDEGRV